MFKISNIEFKHKQINYVLNRNVKEYNLFNTEQFKKNIWIYLKSSVLLMFVLIGLMKKRGIISYEK